MTRGSVTLDRMQADAERRNADPSRRPRDHRRRRVTETLEVGPRELLGEEDVVGTIAFEQEFATAIAV